MSFKAFVNAYIITIISRYLIPIVLALMIITFLYGMMMYFISNDDPKKHADGVKYMLYGSVGIAIAVSIWSIIALGASFFGAGPVIPQLR